MKFQHIKSKTIYDKRLAVCSYEYYLFESRRRNKWSQFESRRNTNYIVINRQTTLFYRIRFARTILNQIFINVHIYIRILHFEIRFFVFEYFGNFNKNESISI